MYVTLVDCLLAHNFLDNRERVISVLDVFDSLTNRGNNFLLSGEDLLHADDVGELVLDSEHLDLLVVGHGVDPGDPNALLIVKLVLEVLDVEILKFGWHSLDLVKKLVVVIVEVYLPSLNHVMQVKLCNFLECERFHADKVAILVMAMAQLVFLRPRLLNENQIFVEPLTELLLNHYQVLIGTRSQDESLIPELFNVPVSNELHLEVACVVLALILMHPLIDVCFRLKWFLDAF